MDKGTYVETNDIHGSIYKFREHIHAKTEHSAYFPCVCAHRHTHRHKQMCLHTVFTLVMGLHLLHRDMPCGYNIWVPPSICYSICSTIKKHTQRRMVKENKLMCLYMSKCTLICKPLHRPHINMLHVCKTWQEAVHNAHSNSGCF